LIPDRIKVPRKKSSGLQVPAHVEYSAIQGKEAMREGSQKKRSYTIYVHEFVDKLHVREFKN
jgi:hypothetical protein